MPKQTARLVDKLTPVGVEPNPLPSYIDDLAGCLDSIAGTAGGLHAEILSYRSLRLRSPHLRRIEKQPNWREQLKAIEARRTQAGSEPLSEEEVQLERQQFEEDLREWKEWLKYPVDIESDRSRLIGLATELRELLSVAADLAGLHGQDFGHFFARIERLRGAMEQQLQHPHFSSVAGAPDLAHEYHVVALAIRDDLRFADWVNRGTALPSNPVPTEDHLTALRFLSERNGLGVPMKRFYESTGLKRSTADRIRDELTNWGWANWSRANGICATEAGMTWFDRHEKRAGPAT